MALLLQIVTDPAQEIATYRTWWSQHRVDGVVVVDPRREDPRLASLAELGLPYVLVGERDKAGMPSVIGDEEGMIEIVITHLLEQGRRRIAYMSGMSTLLHTERRSAAMASLGRSRGVEIMVSTAPDYTERSGAQATTELIAGPRSPDAIVYDNEVLAVGGLTALRQEGRHPGADIALVSLEDSPLCRALNPSLTSVHREPAIMGDTATRLLLEHLSHRHTPAAGAPVPGGQPAPGGQPGGPVRRPEPDHPRLLTSLRQPRAGGRDAGRPLRARASRSTAARASPPGSTPTVGPTATGPPCRPSTPMPLGSWGCPSTTVPLPTAGPCGPCPTRPGRP